MAGSPADTPRPVSPIDASDPLRGVLDAARTNQRWAWESLYRNVAPELLGWLAMRAPQHAVDVLGDVFAALAADIARFDGDSAMLRGWAFRIARARLEIARRAESSGAAAIARSEAAGLEPPTPGSARIAAALAGLDERAAELVYLRLVVDLPLRQVAASFSMPVRTVERQLEDALRALDARAAELAQIDA